MNNKKHFCQLLLAFFGGVLLVCGVSATLPHRVSSGVYGDVDGNGVVDVQDLNEVINVMLGLPHGGERAILVSDESLRFSGEVGGVYTQTLTIRGDNLKGAVNAVVMGGDGEFGVSPATISLSEAQNGTTLTVTYAPLSAGGRSARLLLTSDEATTVTVNLSGTATQSGGASTTTYTVNGVSFTMVGVKGGTFTMGGTAEQGSDAYSDEMPTHEVTLSDFAIGQTEVTQELWVAVMGSNPSYFNGLGNRDYGSYHRNYDYGTNLQRPVEYVSWEDCQTFISMLNDLTGLAFRLPTEAEWEYAARGGQLSESHKYAGSDNVDEVAWYIDNMPSQTTGAADYGTQPVATKASNELGLYDMSGNVAEWCADWYGDYTSAAVTNPTGPTSGMYRVYRGSGWNGGARGCRVAFRTGGMPTSRGRDFGLRLGL